MSLSALERPSYSDFIDERQATKEAIMSTAFDRCAVLLPFGAERLASHAEPALATAEGETA